ncbi:response regulator [Ilumatobacter nonamiensis]|uniref:response regulator n=1 Tax=Ilumatobacter nonamiensis TaxID=467093 RepID=UPI00034D44F7|nr:response regulator transcription factor [Ilumatobacter nonamiensis]
MIRVFLLDDHEIVRRGVAASLSTEPELQVVGEAASAATALAMVRECRPDVAVLDVRLGDGSGIDVCRAIHDEFPEIRSLILTSFESDRALVDARRAGAAGFLLKEIRTTNLVRAIREVAGGRTLLDDAVVRQASNRLHDSEEGRLEVLTPQERQIFDLLGAGQTNRQIAHEVYLAEKTVKNYVTNVLSKLGMSRRAEVAALAARLDERRRNAGYDG